MATEPLTEFEIQYPDPRRRHEIKSWLPTASVLGVAPEMLCSGPETEDTLAFLVQVRGKQSVLRSMFGNDAP